MKLLAIDSSSTVSGCALYLDGYIITATVQDRRPRADLLFRQMDYMLHQAGLEPEELTGFVVGAGPGSFTGLRIAHSAVRAMAQALDKPVAPVCSLQAMALPYSQLTEPVAVVQRARKGFVYCAVFKQNHALGPVEYLAVEQVAAKVRGESSLDSAYYLAGTASDDVAVHGGCSLGENTVGPRPEYLLSLGVAQFLANETVSYDKVLPVYVRPSDAEISWLERQRENPE